MADEKEIIINVQINQEKAAEDAVKVKEALINLTEEKQKLTKAYKEGNITSQEYAESLVRVEGNQKKLSEEYRNLTKVQDTNSNSINALRQKNADLIKERNNLSVTDENYKKKIQDLNKEIDKNNKVIKDNVSASEQQKIGIGGYTDAIGKFFPALGGATQAVGGLNKSLWTLVANPIGAIVTGIIAVFAILYKALTQTAGGTDLLDDAFTSVSTILDVLFDRLGKVAGAVMDLFKGDFAGAADKITGAFSGLGDELERDVKAAIDLNSAMRDLEDREIDFAVASSEVENQIKRLMLQSKNRTLTEKERQGFLDQALELEKKRTDTEVKLSNDKLKAANNAAALRLNIVREKGESEIAFGKRILEEFKKDTSAQADDLRDKVKDMLIARQDTEGKSLNFQEKIQNQRDALLDKQEQKDAKRREDKLKEEQRIADLGAKAYEEGLRLREKMIVDSEKRKKEEEDKRNKEKEQWENSFSELRDRLAKEKEARDKKQADFELKVERFKNAALFSAGDTFFKKKEGLRIATNAIFKKDALKEIAITTRAAAMKAFDAFAKIPVVGPALGGIAAASVIAFGAQQAAQVLGIPFARGGKVLSGQRITSNNGIPIRRSNGDNLLATVRTGEVILNERQQAALGGSATFKRIGVPGFAEGGITASDSMSISRINRTSLQIDELLNAVAQQKTVLVLQDFENANRSKSIAEQNAIIV